MKLASIGPASRIAGAGRLLLPLFAFLCGRHLIADTIPTAAPPALLPRPGQAVYTEGRLALSNDIPVVVPAACPERVLEIAEVLRDELRQRAGLTAKIVRGGTAPASGAILLALTEAGAPADSEAYTLQVAQNAEVRASDPRGLLWGVQTLLQSIESTNGSSALRCCAIADRPARPWRALMLDPARSFLRLDFIRRTIRVMSAYKLNVLHLHLIDDQAWRFEFKAFPKCNPPGEPLYTQKELRALVAYAARYGIEIVPEFDFPGHSQAVIAAYPGLDCENKVRSIGDSILCGGKAFTWEFIDKLVSEAVAVFPSSYLHMGADEPYAIKRWAVCPHCQERMKERGANSLASLYHLFVLDLNAIVRRHGKQMIVWNDAVHPGVEPAPTKDIVIDAWMGCDNAQAWAQAGYALINSSAGPLYLTSYGWGGGLPLSVVRQWNATLFASPDPKHDAQTLQYRELPSNATLLGGQACAWASEQGVVEHRLYPRLLSIAESLWAEGREGDLADFESRMHAAHERLLRTLGVHADEARSMETLFDGRDTTAWVNVGAPALTVTAGELVAVSGPSRGWLRTKKTYRDFILTFEQSSPVPLKEIGIYYGCDPVRASPALPNGRAVSTTAPSGILQTLTQHPEGQWNSYVLTVRGGIVSLAIDDQLAWSADDPAPVAGAIGLAGGNGVKYRAITIRPLASGFLP
ncbi:MAG: family 20 glycosylhydrolase [Opitutaceae bacterium]